MSIATLLKYVIPTPTSSNVFKLNIQNKHVFNFPQPILESNRVRQNDPDSVAISATQRNYLETKNEFESESLQTFTRNISETLPSSAFLRNESETRFKVESEIANITPTSYNASRSTASQEWKNLRLKVKTAKAFNNELAKRNIRRYGYDPRQFQI